MTGLVDLADTPGGGTLFTWYARHANAQATAQHRELGREVGWNAATDQLDALAQTLGPSQL